MTKKFLFLAIALFAIIGLACSQTAAETPTAEQTAAESLGYRFDRQAREVAPIELTAADGTGLQLKLYQAKTVIEGPLAFTELRLTFVNPEDRQREGRFRITLPENAAISRFAMRIDDVWQEAEVVERQAARRAYEDFLHRKQDPALLEKAAGNEFRARIFPIPANGEKELILSYSEELVSSQSIFRLPVQGLPKIADFEVQVKLAKKNQTDDTRRDILVKEKQFQPQGDFVLTGLQTEPSLTSGGYFVARVKPNLDAAPESPQNLLILIDSSASRALGFETQQAKLKEILRNLPSVKKVTVTSFDQTVEQIYQGSVAKLDFSKLQSRGAFGATDLNKALQWASGQQGHERLLLVTDGITTAGPSQLSDSLKSNQLQRLDVVLVGGIRDADKMKLLVEQGLAKEGLVIDGTEPASIIASKLQRSVTSGLDLSMENVEWFWPETLNNLQPGDERLVYAKLTEQKLTPKKLQIGPNSYQVESRQVESSPLLSRSAINAQITRLESQLSDTDDPQKKEALSELIVELSTTHRVLSDKTALLVLESDSDYARFGIDRSALADVLTVGKLGLELKNRSEIHLPKPLAVEKTRLKAKPQKVLNAPGDTTRDLSTVTETESDDIGTRDGAADDGADPPSNRASGQGGGGESEPLAAPAAAPIVQRPSASVATGRSSSSPDSEMALEESPAEVEDKKEERPSALNGKFAEIDALLKKGDKTKALLQARTWQEAEPGNVLALIALGDCLEALGKTAEAARVFGSIIDLFPSRADLRRYAGSRLQSLGVDGLELAVDSFSKAVEQRPDHVSSHRFYAFALARAGRLEEATEAIEAGLSRKYPDGRFQSYDRILRDDLGLLGAAWLKKQPQEKKQIYARMTKYNTKIAKEPSLRFILTWETDANDVDFHIRDSQNGHAYYSSAKLPSGGELYGDVTTGYGPECFAIEGKPKAYPYDLEIHYYSRGPMGYGMGQLEILNHDGKGNLRFEERPYVVMTDGAYVSLGTVKD